MRPISNDYLLFEISASLTICGILFHVQTELYQMNNQGGELKHVRYLAYATNGKVIKNKVLTTSANTFGWTAAVFIELTILATADSESAIL